MADCKPTGAARGTRRDAILEVAREVFLRDGYAAASMSHIASRLGGSKGTLYNYFRSKEELFRAHVQERCSCHALAIVGGPLSGPNPLDVLAELAERVLRYILSDEAIAFYSVVASEAQRSPEVGRAFFESGPLAGTKSVEEYLVWARAEGLIAAEDCFRAAEDFVTLIQGRLYRRRVLNMIPMPDEAEIKDEARRAAGTFMRAYGVTAAF
jgi:AcrR family transcriptional regulator